jgi:hypothetical protein
VLRHFRQRLLVLARQLVQLVQRHRKVRRHRVLHLISVQICRRRLPGHQRLVCRRVRLGPLDQEHHLDHSCQLGRPGLLVRHHQVHQVDRRVPSDQPGRERTVEAWRPRRLLAVGQGNLECLDSQDVRVCRSCRVGPLGQDRQLGSSLRKLPTDA